MAQNILKLPTTNSHALTLSQWDVVSVEGDIMTLRQGNDVAQATLAFSCMVQPIPNDKVVCFCSEDEKIQIMAIAERRDAQPIQYRFPTDASITSPNGSIDIIARDDARVLANKITQISHHWVVQSQQTILDLLSVLAKGDKTKLVFKQITTISDLINTSAKQSLQKFVTYIRKTDQLDQTEAGQVGIQARSLYSVRSKHSMLISEKDTKIDGEHIHMG